MSTSSVRSGVVVLDKGSTFDSLVSTPILGEPPPAPERWPHVYSAPLGRGMSLDQVRQPMGSSLQDAVRAALGLGPQWMGARHPRV